MYVYVRCVRVRVCVDMYLRKERGRSRSIKDSPIKEGRRAMKSSFFGGGGDRVRQRSRCGVEGEEEKRRRRGERRQEKAREEKSLAGRREEGGERG